MGNTANELQSQWSNPSDILSLLLLIGSDIVQKAIAQLTGFMFSVPGTRGTGISINPVALSFGWVAYAFSNLLAAAGDMRLMPASDCPSVVVTCSNGFVRENRSWVLGRLLRDHETRCGINPRLKAEGGREESIRIDIFHLGPVSSPALDLAWWLGLATLLIQLGIALVPWVLDGDWAVMMITLCGNLLVIITCAMPQWEDEKWAGRRLERGDITCLTRGNGHLHIMVFIGMPGSWALETLATSIVIPRPETRWVSLLLAVLWTCLLISISGLEDNTWFLVAIGGIGMLQNVFAAGTTRAPSASRIPITKFSRAPTIIGRRGACPDVDDSDINLEKDIEEVKDVLASSGLNTAASLAKPPKMPKWLHTMSKEDGVPGWLEPLKPEPPGDAGPSRETSDTIYAVGVHGALMELEKWVPTAGLAMVPIFFPTSLRYEDERIRNQVHKRFWRRAYSTQSVRKRAEAKRRAEERRSLVPADA